MRKLLDYCLYPSLLAAGFLITWLLSNHGWTGFVAATIAYWLYVVVIRVTEQLRPFEPAWNRADGQLLNDLGFTFVSYLTFPLSILLLNGVALAMDRFPALNLLNVWPKNWPLIVQIPLGMIISDLGFYLGHRWSHTVPLLWRFHSVHHSAPRLSVINTGRTHIGEHLFILPILILIPVLLGVPTEAALWYGALFVYGGILTHANIDVRCGVLNYLINTPELHRWHHSRHQRETDTNYAYTTFWDHLFRTYYYPKRRPPRDVGIDLPVSANFLEQLLQPLTRAGHHPVKGAIRALPAGKAGLR